MTVCTGCWIIGHIPAVGMEDCHAALKVGGLMVNGTRSMYWEKGEKEGYRDKVDEMIADGKFELVHQYDWTHGQQGVTEGFWREMKSMCFILKKLK